MSDADALLRAVICEPGDDAPRLIYADFLDEHGHDERADLIRWMVRIPSYVFSWNRWRRTGTHRHTEPVRAIRGLRKRLIASCRSEWERQADVDELAICRGFVDAVTIGTDAFLDTAAKLFVHEPIQSIVLRHLRANPSRRWPGGFEATLVRQGPYIADRWPIALFPESKSPHTIVYWSPRDAMADLSCHACAYGRRLAGIPAGPVPVQPKLHTAAQTG
jgi:uncharacterized protein (TIGR02996 family)